MSLVKDGNATLRAADGTANAQGPESQDTFRDKKDGCLKAALKS
ncbi:MAG: hypothetical protein WCZ23_13665 [Rhodospirillaceae bacterium]